MPFENIFDKLMGQQPGTTKTVRDLNKTDMTPKAKAAALKNIKAPNGTGLGLTVSQLIPQGVYDRIGNEIVRGAAVMLGGDTSLMDARISGRPLVKSVGSVDFNVATNEGMEAYKKALEQSKETEEKSTYKPRREALEELYPDRFKDTETRTNGNEIVQDGRNFNTMSDNIFRSMLTRNKELGASEETLAAMRGMRYGTSSLFSSINLPQAESFNSFENPQIAAATGAIQPKGVNPGFSTKDAVQFKHPDSNMPSVATTPGVKMPVEYTNYMRSAEPALSSMDAMRMNERQKGLIYASGQYWGEGADGQAQKVDRELALKVKRGAEGADQLLADFLGRGGLSATASSPVEAGKD